MDELLKLKPLYTQLGDKVDEGDNASLLGQYVFPATIVFTFVVFLFEFYLDLRQRRAYQVTKPRSWPRRWAASMPIPARRVPLLRPRMVRPRARRRVAVRLIRTSHCSPSSRRNSTSPRHMDSTRSTFRSFRRFMERSRRLPFSFWVFFLTAGT